MKEPRHHAVHPPSSVKPNAAVNHKPNPTRSLVGEVRPIPGQPAPNPNPSLGPIGTAKLRECDPDVDDDCDDEDRKDPMTPVLN